MKEGTKKAIALSLDAVSLASFSASLLAIGKIEVPTFPSKPIALAEDVVLLTVQTVETIKDACLNKYENNTFLSKTWHSAKRYGVPVLIGAAAAYGLASVQNPKYNLSTISDFAWVVGLTSQFVKDRILYK